MLSRREVLVGLGAIAEQYVGEPKRHKSMAVAFTYAARLPSSDLPYLANFQLLVSGGILSPDQRQTFKRRKTQLILYLWSSAFYPGDGDHAERSWQAVVAKRAKDWLLSSDPAHGGAASSGRSALWYDFGNGELLSARADHVGTLLDANGYAGVFLDTLGFEAVPRQLREEFQRRYPGGHYDEYQGEFISKLRNKLGKQAIIFTNQGYRQPHLFLPHADFDLIENSSTHIKPDGTTEFRPWYSSENPWESIEVPMTGLVVPAARSFPATQFVHLNYAQGNPALIERAASYSYVCALLWNQHSFLSLPGLQKTVHSRVYFTQLGEPVTASYEEDRKHGVVWRVFRNGVVALNTSAKPYRIRKLELDLHDPPRGYVFLRRP